MVIEKYSIIKEIDDDSGVVKEVRQFCNDAEPCFKTIGGVSLFEVTKTLSVDGNRTDEYTPNGCEMKPFKTIQAAIDAAASGTLLDIVPGTYPEDITLKPGVHLKSRLGLQPGVLITGKVSWPSGAGTILMNGIYVLNDSDHALEFGGTGVQKLWCHNSKFETNSIGAHHAIKHSNTNVGSEIFLKDSLIQVRDSSGGAKAIETLITSQGSIGLDNTTVRVVDDIDKVAVNLKGAIAYWQRMDEIRGRVIVSDLASCNISLDGMYSNTLSCLETHSAGLSILSSVILSSTASPIVTGAGAFSFSSIGYATTGQGLAATLNGGAGAAIGAIPGESADGIIYDNTISELTATRVKTALDEIVNDYQKESEKDQSNGYAGLGADSKINSAQLPAIAIIDTYPVNSEVEQLALTVQKGDVAIRLDEKKSYINKTGNNTSMADWEWLETPTDVVQSVDGRVGIVTLADLYEAIFSKNTGFNKNFGTEAGTVCEGNDSRLGGKTHSPSCQVIWGTASGLLGGNQTVFAHIGGDPAITSTEARGQIRMPKCNVKAIEGYCYNVASNAVPTVRKNGVDTAITGTISATGRFRFTGSVAFIAGDLLSVEVAIAAGGGTGFNGMKVEADVELI